MGVRVAAPGKAPACRERLFARREGRSLARWNLGRAPSLHRRHRDRAGGAPATIRAARSVTPRMRCDGAPASRQLAGGGRGARRGGRPDGGPPVDGHAAVPKRSIRRRTRGTHAIRDLSRWNDRDPIRARWVDPCSDLRWIPLDRGRMLAPRREAFNPPRVAVRRRTLRAG